MVLILMFPSVCLSTRWDMGVGGIIRFHNVLRFSCVLYTDFLCVCVENLGQRVIVITVTWSRSSTEIAATEIGACAVGA